MKSKTIFITGCSTGIGHEAALDLVKRGHRVIASCRKQADVEKLTALGLEAICMNIDDTVSIAAGFKELLNKTGGHLDVLINNAGYGQAGALEDLSREVLRAQYETNVFGLMDLTRLAIPVMRKQGQGRIINISSISGLIAMPFRGAYNSSKFALEGLTDTLRIELQASGIQVITIEPGPIESEFRTNVLDKSLARLDLENSHFSAQYKKMLGYFREHKSTSIFTKSPQAVIDKLIHAIESPRPKPKYLVTFPAHLLAWLKRILSTKMLDRVLVYFSRKELGPR